MNIMKEIQTSLQGTIGKYYKMSMRYKTSKTEDDENELDIRIRIEKLNLPSSISDNINLLKDSYTIILKMNNTIVDKNSIALDFTNSNNLVILNYNKKINNSETLKMNLEAFLKVDNKSNYIEDTSLKDTILVHPVKEDRLFIDLDYTDAVDKIYCTCRTTITPDFIEYKDTLNDWIKLNSNNFEVNKSNKKQFIQVRGKFNGVYS